MRILIWLKEGSIPEMFETWEYFAVYVQRENRAGRYVCIHKWEYV